MSPGPPACAFLALSAAAGDPAAQHFLSSAASWPFPRQSFLSEVESRRRCKPMLPLRHGGRVATSLSADRDDGDGSDIDTTVLGGEGGREPSTRAEADFDDVDIDVDVGDVTDEEVLLACRAYLSRTHRLEWTERERRREGAASVAGRAPVVGRGMAGAVGVGHFWDDPDELPYLLHGDGGLDTGGDDDDDSTGLEEDAVDDDDEDDDDVGVEEDEDTLSSDWDDSPFSGYPQRAPREHSLRSKAARRTWSDPEWREKWYAKRWGDESGWGGRRAKNSTGGGSGDSRMRAKMSSLPPDVLRSPELASLGEEELSDVIRTYVVANRRRSRTRKLLARDPMRWRVDGISRAAGGGGDNEASIISPSFEPSEEALREAQRRRSERAARAYRTRLANLAKEKEKEDDEGGDARVTESITERRSKELPVDAALTKGRSRTSSPHQEAIRRIEAFLDGGEDPTRADVELILKPARLARRREVLLRVLRERFDLMGRCVPPPSSGEDDDDSPRKLFASRCPIGLLGDFVLELLDGRDAERGGR